MITEHKGDLFTSTAPILGHGVNCKGVMGAGIAKTFKAKWPDMYEGYRKACLSKELGPGQVYWWKSGPGKLVLNIASQDAPGANASYDLLVKGMSEALAIIKNWDFFRRKSAARSNIAISTAPVRLAIPRIGCGIGGLRWELVKPLISVLSDESGVIIEIWSFDD